MFDNKTIEIFSSRDMIRQQLINYSQSYLDLEDVDLTKQSYLSYLINILSALTSNLIYYNTSTYREFFLTRAYQKESVLNLASMIGYTPDLAKPSTAQVLVSVPIEDIESNTTLTMYGRHDPDNDAFRFYADKIPFTVLNEIKIDIIVSRGKFLMATVVEKDNITGAQRYVNWRITEKGKYISFLVNTIQVDDYRYDFRFPILKPYQYYNHTIPVDGDFAGIVVTTTNIDRVVEQLPSRADGRSYTSLVERESGHTTWTKYPSLFLIKSGDHGYTYRIGEDNVKVFFGNGIIGMQPTSESKCDIVISTTKGLDGNVIAGSIDDADPLIGSFVQNNVVKTIPIGIKCINPSAAIGGKSYPTIDEIRGQAIAQVSTNNRLVTEYDFNRASEIVRDIPIQHSLPILKRSDLKRNEICLFTDVIFGNEYVPTRNSVIRISKAMVESNDNKPFTIKFNDEVDIDMGKHDVNLKDSGHTFVSMFNLTIDPIMRTCSYYHGLVSDISKEVTLKKTWTGSTTIYPNNTTFELINEDDSSNNSEEYIRITIEYNTMFTDIRQEIPISCDLSIDEYDDMHYDMIPEEKDNITTFYVDIPLVNIPEGDISFLFTFRDGNDNSPILMGSSNMIIKQSLTEFMYSKITVFPDDTDDGSENNDWGIIYDVPTILKDYMDSLEHNNQLNTFINQVLHRIATFDVTKYRMITDFVNLKFSNTFGYINNMKFNPDTRGVFHILNPGVRPDILVDGYTCLVTSSENPWAEYPYNQEVGGFLARSIVKNDTLDWVFSKLHSNDILLFDPIDYTSSEYVDDDDLRDDIISVSNRRYNLQKFIYNGDNIYNMILQTPVEIEVDIWKSDSVNISDNALTMNIRDSLIDSLIPHMGYDKPLYISEITKIVQQTPGVEFCKVRKPGHDIFFNYDIGTLSQEDLMRYSPQLVYIDTDSININIRKNR